MILKGVADRRELGDFPGAAMASAEGLGYFVEMVRGDWSAAEVELRRGYDELSAMGDKNYLATVAGWLAHCTYRLGQYDQATAFAEACEGAAARTRSPLRCSERGARDAARTQRRRRRGRGARTHAVDVALGTDRADTQTDALMSLAEVLRVGGRPAGGRPVVEDALRRYEHKEVVPAANRARPPRRARHRRSRYVGRDPAPVASPE